MVLASHSYSSPLDEQTKGSLEGLHRIVNAKVKMDAMKSQRETPTTCTDDLNTYILNTARILLNTIYI